MPARAWVFILTSALLLGCGYRNAMTRGETAEAQKDWAAAAAAYETALRHDPEDPDAARALADVQRRWHVQSISRFEKALQTGNLDAAGAALREAEAARPEAEVNQTAAARLASASRAKQARKLRGHGKAQLAAAKIDQALEAYAKAEALHATAEGEAGVDAAVAAIIARSEAHEAAGRWALADFDRGIVAAHRSTGPDEHAALRARWVEAWQAESAAHAAADRLASAYVRAAQIARLAPQRPELIARRDALRTRLVVPLVMRRTVALSGEKSRIKRVLDALPPPSSTDPASPLLRVEGSIGAVQCAQTEHVAVRSKKYVAGIRVVRNPDWIDARQAARRLRNERVNAERRQNDADQAVWRAERELAEKQRRIAEERQRRRRQLRRDLERARDEERRCQDALSGASASQQSSARSRLDRATRAVRSAWDALDRFAREDHGADRAWRELESARERLEDARRDAARAREREDDAERRVDGLQPTTEVPRYATHRYPVSTWTRTCRARLTVTMQRADAEAETIELSAESATRDRTHRAQVVIALDADPLRFPKSDRTLAGRVDDALAKALRARIEAERARWVDGLVEVARDPKTPPDERVRHAVGAVFNGRANGPARAILRETLAVEDPRILE